MIAAMVGLDTRATMDMDVTIKGLPVTEESVRKIFDEICNVELEDDVTFSFQNIGKIRDGDEYNGYRVSLHALYPPMAVPLKLDITTGDKITPKEIIYEFKLLLEDRSIKVLAYNIETVMAEKLETIIARGDQNTRPRDFYDVYVLRKLQERNINYKLLKEALLATTEKRNSLEIMKNYKRGISVIVDSELMNKRWLDYQKDFEYAIGITFQDTCIAVKEVLDKLF